MKNISAKIFNGKWYSEPMIYDTFAIAEDIDDICLNKIKTILGKDFKAKNPIDLASGTGRMANYILKSIPYSGVLYTIESNKAMCEFLEKKYDNWEAVVIRSTIEKAQNHPILNCIKSNLIVSRFGFPSKIWDKKLAYEELEAVYYLLEKNGLLITFGWDENFNDELNRMWYNYVPDGIIAKDFNTWCKERKSAITSPRNANLAWAEEDVATVLQFEDLQESAFIMGKLFGDKALRWVVDNNKVSWKMKMAITANTREDIGLILQKYAR